jgi:hypothetical protein
MSGFSVPLLCYNRILSACFWRYATRVHVVVVVFGLLLACVDGGGWIFAGGDWAICDGTLFFGVGVDREKALFLKRHTYTHTRIYISE